MLHDAVSVNNVKVTQMLIDLKLDVNLKNISGRAPLHVAVQLRYLESIELLLKNNADVNVLDNEGMTPLHLAVVRNNLPAVEMLLKYNADINILDNSYKSSLHYAIESKNLDVIRALCNQATINFKIQSKSSSNAIFSGMKNHEGKSMLHEAVPLNNVEITKILFYTKLALNIRNFCRLHVAAEFGFLESIELLLKNNANANVNVQDNEGRTPLHLAVLGKNLPAVEILLKYNADINILDKSDKSALHYAIEKKNLEVIKVLCNQAKINFKIQNKSSSDGIFSAMKGHEGKTILQQAVSVNNVNVTQILLDCKPDLNLKDNSGRAPLHLAAEFKFLESIELLLENNADVNVLDNEGMTPLHLAVLRKNLPAVEMLLKYKADVNLIDNGNNSAVHYAIRNENLAVIKLLCKQSTINFKIQKKSCPNRFSHIINHEGKTILHVAVSINNEEITQILLDLKPDLNLKDYSGRAPLHLACELMHLKSIELLLKNNADANVLDNAGMTPLHLAVRKGDLPAVEMLLKYNADVNILDNCDKSALHYAIEKKDLDVIGTLCDQPKINFRGFDDLVNKCLPEIKKILVEAWQKKGGNNPPQQGLLIFTKSAYEHDFLKAVLERYKEKEFETLEDKIEKLLNMRGHGCS